MKNELPAFDKCDNLDILSEHKLPEGYRFVFHKSSDHDEWI